MIFSPTPTVVTMKFSSNAQSATSNILINVDPYKAISARDIEPNPYEFKKFPQNLVFEKVRFLFTISGFVENFGHLAFCSWCSDYGEI